MNRNIRDKRNELYWKTRELKETYSKIEDYDKCWECMNKERELYKKWNFYDKFMKAVEKEKQNDKVK